MMFCERGRIEVERSYGEWETEDRVLESFGRRALTQLGFPHQAAR